MTMTTDPSLLLRELGGKPLHRSMAVDLSTLNKENRTVEIAASSEYPVQRWFGMEILDHSEAAVDLTRMNSGAPLLDMHDRWSQIGIVELAWLDDDRKLRCRVRFSRSQAAEEVWQDVVDQIRVNVSIGYNPITMALERTEGDTKFYRVTRWEPYEVSSVSIPADPTVGVGRSLPEIEQPNTVRGPEMSVATTTTTGAPDTAAALQADRQRGMDILALCEQHGKRDLAMPAIAEGLTVEQVSARILGALTPAALGQGPESKRASDLPGFVKDVSARGLGLTEKEGQRYSLIRAIEASASNDWKAAGFEREVSIAVADAMGREARGFFVPHDLLAARAGMSKAPGVGAELVDTELRIDQFIDLVRNRTVTAALGARIMAGLQGDVDIPKKIGGANFQWLAEGQNVELSKMDLTTVGLRLKTIAGGIPVTRKLRNQSAMSIDRLIVDELIGGVAVAMDLGILTGTGENNTPLGVFSQPGIPGLKYAASGITFDDLVDMETKIATFNADMGALQYLTGTAQRGYAKKKKEDPDGASSDRLWRGNEVNGHKAMASNQVPADAWAFGDWSQIIIGLWGALDLKPDTAALAGSDGLVIRVFQDCDTANRNPSSFCIARKTQ
jgi:hypothetical protein